MLQALIFGSIYVLIFSGYYTVTGFLNIIYPENGFWSFVCFYTTYAIFSLLAPFFLSKINQKLLFSLSGLSFVIFIGFASSKIFTLLLIGSLIGGIGNSFIWLIQGTYLSANKEISMGVFYSLFNINMIFGNLISVIVLTTGASVQVMVWCMIGVSSLGTLLIFFFKYDPTIVENKNNEIENKNILTKTKDVFLSFKQCDLIVLCMIYSSVGLNVTYQIIPRLILLTANTDKEIFNSVTYITYGVSAIMASFLWGKLFTKSWRYVLYPYTILEILCLIGIFLLAKFNNIVYYWIIIGFIRGIIDYGVNNLINLSLSNLPNPDNVFGLYRFVYSISYLITAICVGYVPYEYVLLMCAIICVIATISYSLGNYDFSKEIKEITLEEQFNNSTISVKN